MIKSKKYEYVLSIALPALILLVVFALRGIYPFGSTSVVIWDENYQYVGFFSWLSGVLQDGGSLLYSATQGIGESTISLITYYLSSPFNLLAAFFSPMDSPQLLSIITLIKLPFAGLTCYIFLRKRFGTGTICVILSMAYAINGYSVMQCSNIMWIDGVIMLPLVALGTWRAAEGKHLWPLFVSVTCVVVFNWYVGFMCCLFAACYFLVCSYINNLPLRNFVKRGLRFAATMVLALCATMTLFLPSIIGLMSGANTDISSSYYAYLHANPASFAVQYCVEYASDNMSPGIFMTSIAPILALTLFFNRRVSRKVKLGLGALALFLLLAFYLYPLDILWSSFKIATSFYFRYAFVFDFIVVILAIEGYIRLFDLERKENFIVFAKSGFLFGLLIAIGLMNLIYYAKTTPITFFGIYLQFGLIVLICLLLHIRTMKAVDKEGVEATALSSASGLASRLRVKLAGILSRLSRFGHVCIALLLVIALAEHGIHTYIVFNHYTNTITAWSEYVDSLGSMLENIDVADNAPMRVGEAGISYTGDAWNYVADSASFGRFQSMGEYTSTQGSSTTKLFTALGYTSKNNIFGFYYDSPMLVADSLMGVECVISSQQTPGLEATGIQMEGHQNYQLYKNKYTLPFAYAVAESGTPEFSSNPFDNQEKMFADVTGSDDLAASLYQPAQIETTEGIPSDTFRTWSVTTTQSGPLYLQFPTVGVSVLRPVCDLKINGSYVGQVDSSFWGGVRYVGTYEAGETVTVSLSLNANCHDGERAAKRALWADCNGLPDHDDTLGETTTIIAESLNIEAFEQIYNQVQTPAQVQSFEDGHVVLACNMQQSQKLLVSIPYDEGWSATIDGKPVDVECFYTGLCGLSVDDGEHTIELTYSTPGLAAGAGVSVASLGVFAIWRVMAKRRRSTPTETPEKN